MKNSIVRLFVLLMGLVAMNAQAADFDYDFVDIRGQAITYTSLDGNGILGDVGYSIDDKLFLLGAYSYGEGSDVDLWVENLLVSIGYHTPIDDKMDGVIYFGLLTQWIETNAWYDSDTGTRIHGMIRYRAAPNIELNGGLIHVDIFDESDIGMQFGLLVTQQNKRVSWGVDYESVGDLETFSLFARCPMD